MAGRTTRAAITGHDGRAKPAWAARTGPAGAPQPPISASVCVSLDLKNPGDFTVAEGHGYPLLYIYRRAWLASGFCANTVLVFILRL
jgi:hypothetical protein